MTKDFTVRHMTEPGPRVGNRLVSSMVIIGNTAHSVITNFIHSIRVGLGGRISLGLKVRFASNRTPTVTTKTDGGENL